MSLNHETPPACVFCAIAAGNTLASVVYRDDRALAFMDIAPVNLGHLLVVPREHHASLGELPEEVGMHLFAVARRLAGALRTSGIRCEGVNLYLADGVAAGQEVFHCHLHVIPRFAGDGFHLRVKRPPRPSREELDALARRITDARVK